MISKKQNGNALGNLTNIMRKICGITTLNALMMKESLHFNFCLKRVLVERLDVDTATLMMSGMTCDIHRLTPVS